MNHWQLVLCHPTNKLIEFKYIVMNASVSSLFKKNTKQKPTDDLELSKPVPEDGAGLNDLIAQCPPLDTNSTYCNLLQCTHFSETSIKAELDGDLVGFISGYIPPEKNDTLFVWQVAVSSKARGRGLGKRMLISLLERTAREYGVSHLETTITPDNKASWALFTGVAEALDTRLKHKTLFECQRHFDGKHDDEVLLRIGPFDQKAAAEPLAKFG